MKKILSIFAAMLCAGAVYATPVVLPATLDVSNVGFRSEGMPDFVLEEGDYAGTYFDMGAHDSSNDTLLYAEWDVTIEPLKYDIDVVVYNENSWRVQLYLLNQAGDTVKNLRYKGSSGQCGKYAIGSIDMRDLAAGNYKLRARAATGWSKMKLKELIVAADYKGVNVDLPGTLQPAYAELSSGASISNHAIAFAPSTAPSEYATWNVSFAKAESFRVSIDITASNGHNYGVALLSADGETEIAALTEGGQNSKTGVIDLGFIEVPAAGNYIVKLTNSIKWSEALLNSITFAGPQTLYLNLNSSADWAGYTTKFAAYYFDETTNGWSDMMTAVPEEDNIYTTTIPAGYTSVIFVRFNADATTPRWDSYDGEYYVWSQTVNLEIPEGKDMFIITSGGAGSECNGYWVNSHPAHANGYYLVGTINGVTSWEAADERIMTVNTSAEGLEYMINVTLVDGDALKVIKSEYDNYTWFPNEGGDFEISNKYAGAKTVYFRPNYDGGTDEGWLKKCIYIAPNEATAIDNTNVEGATAKRLENGMLIIIKNGVKYNAQGAVVK